MAVTMYKHLLIANLEQVIVVGGGQATGNAVIEVSSID